MSQEDKGDGRSDDGGGCRRAGPEVEGLDAAVYVVPTDAPEGDGTLAWDKITLVLVTVPRGLGARPDAAATRIHRALMFISCAGGILGRY
jgi:hypothetical protein